jgi:hypothetical protein
MIWIELDEESFVKNRFNVSTLQSGLKKILSDCGVVTCRDDYSRTKWEVLNMPKEPNVWGLKFKMVK